MLANSFFLTHRGALTLSAVIVFFHLLIRIFPENFGGVVFLVPGNTLTVRSPGLVCWLSQLNCRPFTLPSARSQRPWMLLTCNLVEDSLLNLVLSLGAIAGSSFLLADRWDEVEAGRYLLIVGVLQVLAPARTALPPRHPSLPPALSFRQASLSWVAMVSLYILFREHHFLFARLGGLTGLVGALSVAVAQQVHACSGQ